MVATQAFVAFVTVCFVMYILYAAGSVCFRSIPLPYLPYTATAAIQYRLENKVRV